MSGKLYIFSFIVLLLEFCGALAGPGSWAAGGGPWAWGLPCCSRRGGNLGRITLQPPDVGGFSRDGRGESGGEST